MMGLRDGVARRSKLARGVAASTCTIVGTMMVKFVRPRPMVLVQLSVSMGRKGKITMPPIGPNSSLKSFAERSGLNLARLTLRLSKGSSSRTLLLAALEDTFFIGWISPFTVIRVRGVPFLRTAGEGVGLRAKRVFGAIATCAASPITRSSLHGQAFRRFQYAGVHSNALFPIARTFPKYQSPDSILKPQKKKKFKPF